MSHITYREKRAEVQKNYSQEELEWADRGTIETMYHEITGTKQEFFPSYLVDERIWIAERLTEKYGVQYYVVLCNVGGKKFLAELDESTVKENIKRNIEKVFYPDGKLTKIK